MPHEEIVDHVSKKRRTGTVDDDKENINLDKYGSESKPNPSSESSQHLSPTLQNHLLPVSGNFIIQPPEEGVVWNALLHIPLELH